MLYIKRGLEKRLREASFDSSTHCGQVRDVSNWAGFDRTYNLWPMYCPHGLLNTST